MLSESMFPLTSGRTLTKRGTESPLRYLVLHYWCFTNVPSKSLARAGSHILPLLSRLNADGGGERAGTKVRCGDTALCLSHNMDCARSWMRGHCPPSTSTSTENLPQSHHWTTSSRTGTLRALIFILFKWAASVKPTLSFKNCKSYFCTSSFWKHVIEVQPFHSTEPNLSLWLSTNSNSSVQKKKNSKCL